MRRITATLLLCLGLPSPSHADFDSSNGCPGTNIDNHYYVTDTKTVFGCIYSIEGSFPFPPTRDRLAEYTCHDYHRKKKCYGYIINPNYAYWDNDKREYFESPVCPYPISACQDLDDVCIPGGARECDDFHHYMCESKHLNRTVEDGNTTREVPAYCEGKVDTASHYLCPPRDVASFEEVTHWCTREVYLVNRTHYRCEYYNRVVCEGRIDPDNVILPTCSEQALSCSQAERNKVCKMNTSPIEETFCGAKFDIHENGTVSYRGNTMECPDRRGKGWCRSELDPALTTKFMLAETCPTESLDYCMDVKSHFVYPEYCTCIQNLTTGEDVAFVCHHDGKQEPWCQGVIEKPRLDAHLRPIPKHSIPQIPKAVAPADTKKETGITGTCSSGRCKTGVSFMVFSVAGVALLMVRRRHLQWRYAKTSVEYEIDEFQDELELQTSSNFYSDSPREPPKSTFV
jgi:hypothetical protein